jgi:dihydroorotate dehydrogenase electron transfer subunit
MMRPRPTTILQRNGEGRDMVTFTIECKEQAQPGNFLLIWLPFDSEGGRNDDISDEIPMSVCQIRKDTLSFTVKAVGPTTSELIKLRDGDFIGVSGPYGNEFTIEDRPSLLIGGGVGIAPLMPVYRRMVAMGIQHKFIIGGATREDIPYLTVLRSQEDTLVSTEDGSLGHMGNVLDVLDDLDLDSFEAVYGCGPMPMLRAIWDRLKDTDHAVEMSLESFLRCGRGLCGSCAVGKYRICKEGPVFDRKMLEEVGFPAPEEEL